MTTGNPTETTATHPMEDRLRLGQRPIERDTRLIREEYVWIGDNLPVALERWTWDGIRGSSAVMLTEHVRELNDAALVAILNDGGIVTGGQVTIKRDDSYTFVNFAFRF